MKIILLGLGNPSLCDDSIGFRVAQRLRKVIDKPEVSIQNACVSGIDVLFLISEYDMAVIVDAVQTPEGKVGDVYRLDMDEAQVNTDVSPHSLDFIAAIRLGRELGFPLPSKIWVYAIEADNISGCGENCTPDVAVAVENCVDRLIVDFGLVSEH